jgi:hypothetical protein
MSDRYNQAVIPGISVGSAVITLQADIANTVASSFSVVCS